MEINVLMFCQAHRGAWLDCKWKKLACKVKDWQSWMTTLISVSSQRSLVLWGHLVWLRCCRGFMCNPPFTPVHALKAGTNRHTTLEFFQPSMCSHWSNPQHSARELTLEQLLFGQWDDLHEEKFNKRTLLWANNKRIHRTVCYKLKTQMLHFFQSIFHFISFTKFPFPQHQLNLIMNPRKTSTILMAFDFINLFKISFKVR